jgi:hypothetical protein
VAGKGKISFIYDAAGVKQRKVVRDEQDNILLRQKYIGNTELRDDAIEAVYHDDGRLTPKEDGGWQHEYVLKDHLGNTRVMFADVDNDQVVDASEILQRNSVRFAVRSLGCLPDIQKCCAFYRSLIPLA